MTHHSAQAHFSPHAVQECGGVPDAPVTYDHT